MADIPPRFAELIEQGRCTLFLGAGASASAGAPSGTVLGQALAEKYLGDLHWDLGLERAASLICAQPGSRTNLEREIQDALGALRPSEAHKKIPWFRWHAIVTTNYDRLVEMAYRDEPGAVQELRTITEENDLSGTEPADTLLLIKPHGCISRPHEMSISSEDIYHAKRKRRFLFERILMLHVRGPVIYVGYSLHDRHILDMLFEATRRMTRYRMPILFVSHQADARRAEMERQWFESLQCVYHTDGFENFMDQLSREVEPPIGASGVIPQMRPCRVLPFSCEGDDSSYTITKKRGGDWECWFSYRIREKDGYAGVMFEKRGDPLDFANYREVTFELNVPDAPRKEECVEALKLEGIAKILPYSTDIGALKGKGWSPVRLDLQKRPRRDCPRDLRRVVLADNGERAKLGFEYRVGIRNVRFT